jgi:FKBP-type peptidyl-prolyl cis-trans isomerase FkpA
MRKLRVMALMVALVGCQQQGAGRGGDGARLNPRTDEQKAFYALGFELGRDTQVFAMTPEELEYLKAGLTAYATGEKPLVDVTAQGPKIAELARTRISARAAVEREKSKPFLEEAARQQGAVRTGSGLIFRSLKEGTGPQPAATDMVKVNYRVTLPDGKEAESSYSLEEPPLLPVNGIVQCWNEGVRKMKVGGKATLVCPSELVYGDRGSTNIPGGSAVRYEVELLDVQKHAPGTHDSHGHGPH